MKKNKKIPEMTPAQMVCHTRIRHVFDHADGIDTALENLIKDKKAGRITWPAYTYIPSDISVEMIVGLLSDEEKMDAEALQDWPERAMTFPAYLAWSQTESKTRIIAPVLERIKVKEIPLYLEPSRIKKVFFCPIYIDCEGLLETPQGKAEGFFVWLDYQTNTKETYLNFDLLIDHHTEFFTIPLKEGTLFEISREMSEDEDHTEYFELLRPLVKTILWIASVRLNPKELEKETAAIMRLAKLSEMKAYVEDSEENVAVRRTKPVRAVKTARKRDV